ncbi:hypothetical protein [Jannaschia rubra]|uniref:Uncharacterized protein n=1 Tax=Jannaschia rubra TaxID=282197 RepID=A0A0M6XQA7_9RHOB|nr:hypothetical protein [Jannaschia rubra]CTQ33078.1 hypothetical protein JAN5088_01854 [Jannaschia rubra]SFG74573.1 hypothetical protein SAMN04488517_11347 [Jannaschia rubra]
MIDLSDQPVVPKTSYEREQAHFASLRAEARERTPSRWRRWIARLLGR